MHTYQSIGCTHILNIGRYRYYFWGTEYILLVSGGKCPLFVLQEASNGKDILMTPQSSRHERDVDPGEFEPQVVELPLMASVEEEEGVVAEETKSRKESGTIKKELTEEERTELWIKRLQKMREDYLSSMTEEERVKFLKCLEL